MKLEHITRSRNCHKIPLQCMHSFFFKLFQFGDLYEPRHRHDLPYVCVCATRPCPTPASSASIFLRDLKSNRVDLCCRVVTSSLFISHGTRRNTTVALQLAPHYTTDTGATVIFDGDLVRHVKPDEQCIATLLQKALKRFESSDTERGGHCMTHLHIPKFHNRSLYCRYTD